MELHTLIEFDSEKNTLGLPSVLVTSVAKNNQALYQMLLILICMRKLKNVAPQTIIGFISLVMWFNNGVDFSALYKKLLNEPVKSFEEIAKQWLFEMVQTEKMLIPPPVSVYNAICDAVDPSKAPTMDRVYTAWNPAGYQAGINRIWYWTQREAREILLYVCRNYLAETFGSYDPASIIWNEDSCPWDYDHIFPQNWVVSGRGNRQGIYHELVSTFFNCIGNIAPLHFSLNRSKSDDAPEKNYFGLKDKLFILDDKNNSLFEAKPESCIEYDKTGKLPFQYTNIIAKRFQLLYSKWYSDLNIDGLLDFSNIKDDRKKIFQILHEKDSNFKAYYLIENGKQLPLLSDSETDWARPWIACGIKMDDIDSMKNKCLVCIASNGRQYEIGLRRHPDDDKINNNSGRWWFEQDRISPAIKDILSKLRDTAQENNIQLIER